VKINSQGRKLTKKTPEYIKYSRADILRLCHLLSSRLYCRLRNFTESCQA